jgi:hypothetical protein
MVLYQETLSARNVAFEIRNECDLTRDGRFPRLEGKRFPAFSYNEMDVTYIYGLYNCRGTYKLPEVNVSAWARCRNTQERCPNTRRDSQLVNPRKVTFQSDYFGSSGSLGVADGPSGEDLAWSRYRATQERCPRKHSVDWNSFMESPDLLEQR